MSIDKIEGLKTNSVISFGKAIKDAVGTGGKVLAPGRYLAKITKVGTYQKESREGNTTNRLGVDFEIIEASSEDVTEVVKGIPKTAELFLTDKAKWKAATLALAALGDKIADEDELPIKKLLNRIVVLEIIERAYTDKNGASRIGDEIEGFYPKSDWMFENDDEDEDEDEKPKSKSKTKSKKKDEDDDDDDFI
jgi:hypothetical protein